MRVKPDFLLTATDLKIYLTASAGVKTFYCIPNVKFHFRCIGRQKELRQMQLMRDYGQLDRNKVFLDLYESMSWQDLKQALGYNSVI